MIKKISILTLTLLFYQFTKAQQEFITIWQPNHTQQINLANPQFQPPGPDQIWFPGIGENYTISWEEIGYPQHHGTLLNVTSTESVLIDFGPALNPVSTDATYMLKVSNGSGLFKQIKFSDDTVLNSPIFDNPSLKALGSADRIIEIAQWGNTKWTSMKSAFSQCGLLDITATDAPDLSNVTDASMMFYNSSSLQGNSSLTSWNTSQIKNFKYMFGRGTFAFQTTDNFDALVGNWDMSSAEDISYMFYRRTAFNQNLNDWNTANITTMAYTFADCNTFNQPLDKWNTSKVTNMAYMFHYIPNFNQPLNTWDTSNVTNMGHMFHIVSSFNQPLDLWDVSNVTEMNTMFSDATSFNQTLKDWNLKSLNSAFAMLTKTGMDCSNYSTSLHGWANNPSTPNNINLSTVMPATYSTNPAIITARNTLLNTKGWIFVGDSPAECGRLGTIETTSADQPSVFPNPVEEVIQLKNFYHAERYVIFDITGKLVLKDNLSKPFINVQSLTKGNYIIQIITKDKNYTFKFIKK